MTETAAKKLSMNSTENDRVGFGIAMVVGGVMTFALQDIVMRTLGTDMSVWQLQFLRSLIGIGPLMLGAYLFLGKAAFVIHNWRLHLFRGIIGFTGYSAFYLGLMQLSMAEAGTLFYTGPIIITILSALFLKEQLGPYRIGAVCVGFIGIIVLMRPGAGVFNLAALFPLYCAFAYAATMVVVRHFRNTETATGLAIYVNVSYMTYSGVASLLCMWLLPDPSPDSLFYPATRPWVALSWDIAPMLLLMGLAGVGGHLLMTAAYKSAPASTIAPFDYTYVPLIVLAGYLFWDEVPDGYAILGIVLIVGSGLFIGYRETVRARQEGRRKLTANRVILPSTMPHTRRPNVERAPSDQLPD